MFSMRYLLPRGVCFTHMEEPLKKISSRSLGFLMENLLKSQDRGMDIPKSLAGRCYNTTETSSVVTPNLLNRAFQEKGFESIETVKEDVRKVVCEKKTLLLLGEAIAIDCIQPLNPSEFSALCEDLRAKGFEVILPRPLGDKNSRGNYFFCMKLIDWKQGSLVVAKKVDLSDIWKTSLV